MTARLATAILLVAVCMPFYLSESRAPRGVHEVEPPLQFLLLVGSVLLASALPRR